MKVVYPYTSSKEHLPIKYTQNIKYRMTFFELNQEGGLLSKNPLQKERVLITKCNGYFKFLFCLYPRLMIFLFITLLLDDTRKM